MEFVMAAHVYLPLLCVLCLVTSGLPNGDSDFFPVPATCNQDADCGGLSPAALCVPFDPHITSSFPFSGGTSGVTSGVPSGAASDAASDATSDATSVMTSAGGSDAMTNATQIMTSSTSGNGSDVTTDSMTSSANNSDVTTDSMTSLANSSDVTTGSMTSDMNISNSTTESMTSSSNGSDGNTESMTLSTNSSDVTTISMTSATSGSHVMRCRCNSDRGFHKQGNTCVQHIPVGGQCSNDVTTRCVDEHAQCVSDGTNVGRYRCTCGDGYVSVYVDGRTVCGRKLTVAADRSCYECDHNEGTCYDVDSDGSQDGCLCPITRSGGNCSVQHVSVSCDVDQFLMVICYLRHPHIDFSPSLGLHVTGRDDDDTCRGHDVTSGDAQCPDWDAKLVLDLHKDRRGRCGTREITRIPNVRKFENSVTAAAGGPVIDTMNSVTFTAFCQFTTSAQTSFTGVNVNGLPGNNRGEFKQPGLNLGVETRLGTAIPEGVALRLGDKIRFTVGLLDDGIYSALRVEQCAASSSPVIPDPKAVTMPLNVNSCPADGQSIIDETNNWHSVGGALNDVQTGLVSVFKMSRGTSVFLHCNIKLCLRGAESDCAPAMCSRPAGHYGYGRRRREADVTTSVSRELRWYDESADIEAARQVQAAPPDSPPGSVTMGAAGFGALLTLLLGLLLVLALISALLVHRLRRGNFTNPPDHDLPEARPQRFALPRLNRNTFRI